MNRMRSVRRRIETLGLAAAVWLAADAALAAKPVADSPETGAGPWVMPYFIVILCVAMGMLTVLRTSRRSAQARPK